MPKHEDLPGIKGPGVSAVRIEEVDSAMLDYVEERDRRCAITPKEVEAKRKLIELLHANEAKIGRDAKGVLRYTHEDLVIELKPGKEKLKVRSVGDDDDENGEGEE